MKDTIELLILLLSCVTLIGSICSLLHINKVDKELKMHQSKIEFTNDLIKNIDVTIELHVIKKIKLSSMLGEPYRLMNFDNDVSSISTDIFNSFNNDIFVNNRTIYTNNYIMSYITTNVSIVLFDYIQTYERGTQ